MNQDDIITPELSYNIEAEKPQEVKDIEAEQLDEETQLATIINHKGWNILANDIQRDIKDYSDITKVTQIKDSEQLVVAARSNAVIADYLRTLLKRVEDAARE